jgi:hypothetical protein
MTTIEFQAKVENGIIVIPEEYKQDLVEVSTVKITVSKLSQESVKHPDIIDQLTENPIPVDSFLTKDEAHERSL